MALDPQVQAMLEQMEKAGAPPMHTLSPKEARAAHLARRKAKGEEVGQIIDRTIPGPNGDIPIRIYYPRQQKDVKWPILVYYHGGGWVIGSIESHDAVCRSLTNGAECIVVSVDYRLGPEHKFPAALEDSFAALEWISEQAESFGGDHTKIAVGGDSAGGNLATVCTIKAKENQSPKVMYQLLIYPSTGVGPTQSNEENGEGFILTKDLMDWFRKHYLNHPDDAKNPYFSPYLYDDVSGLPSAFVITAEYDMLRDDGKAYANKLAAAGVPVSYRDYPGMIHGFIGMANVLDQGKRALEDASQALRKAFQTNK